MNIAIKNPSASMMARLNQRAAMNKRTPEDEARVILEEALAPSQKTPVGIEAVAAEIRKLGLRTPSESVQIIREDRDR
jgi:plasmid stability protein